MLGTGKARMQMVAGIVEGFAHVGIFLAPCDTVELDKPIGLIVSTYPFIHGMAHSLRYPVQPLIVGIVAM